MTTKNPLKYYEYSLSGDYKALEKGYLPHVITVASFGDEADAQILLYNYFYERGLEYHSSWCHYMLCLTDEELMGIADPSVFDSFTPPYYLEGQVETPNTEGPIIRIVVCA